MSQQLLGTTFDPDETPEKGLDWRRLSLLHRQTDNLPGNFVTISRMIQAAGKLGVSRIVVETATLYLAKLRRNGLMKNQQHLGAAALALACRLHTPSTQVKSVAKAYGLKPLSLTTLMYRMADELGIKVTPPDPRPNFLRAVESLGLDRAMYLKVSEAVANLDESARLMRRPATLFGGLLYKFCFVEKRRDASGKRITQKSVAAAFGVAEYTIREFYSTLVP